MEVGAEIMSLSRMCGELETANSGEKKEQERVIIFNTDSQR